MKLLDQVDAACKTRHFAKSTRRVYVRWIEEFIRFHRRPDGTWQHPKDLAEPAVEAFLTHLAVNRHVAESTQNQAFYTHVMQRPGLGVRSPLDVVLCRESPVAAAH